MRQQEEEKKRKKEEQKAASQGNTKKEEVKKKEKQKSLAKRILLFLYLCSNHFGMISCFSPTVKKVTIDDFDWERTINVEEIVTHNESDWSLPNDARLQYTKEKSGHTKMFLTTTKQ
ncbi:MAG: hypothetical protein ACLTS6_09085 [Anaerobutyricum sp.]